MTGSVLAAVPVLNFFGFVQRKIALGLTAGAVKG
jgi:ABC-type maltose transport system permease subunit